MNESGVECVIYCTVRPVGSFGSPTEFILTKHGRQFTPETRKIRTERETPVDVRQVAVEEKVRDDSQYPERTWNVPRREHANAGAPTWSCSHTI